MNFKYYKTELLVIFILVLYFPCSFLSDYIEKLTRQSTMLDSMSRTSHSFSTLTLMLVVIVFIDKVGWKWRVFKWLVDLPNLNGRYKGHLLSSYADSKGVSTRKECVVEIRQTASKVHISSYFADGSSSPTTSSSHSVSEEIRKEENGFFKLYYIFVNDTGFLEGEVRNHTGTANFSYLKDKKTLSGEYYNQRLNKGAIVVQFQQKKKLGRFNEEIQLDL